MSACKLTHKTLLPMKAAVLYPHAVKHIAARITEERLATKDRDFRFERTIGNVMIYSTSLHRKARYKSYFMLIVNDLDKQQPATLSIFLDRRFIHQLTPTQERNMQLDTVRVHIIPSFEKPLLSCILQIEYFVSGAETASSSNTKAYADGFQAILPDLIFNLCALKYTGGV
jgi:hypothetical protein